LLLSQAASFDIDEQLLREETLKDGEDEEVGSETRSLLESADGSVTHADLGQ